MKKEGEEEKIKIFSFVSRRKNDREKHKEKLKEKLKEK